LPTLAANRGTEPAKLTRLVRGELDWIVMKALEKDRGRRYETANGFAMDVQRYLADEPVLACPPSAGYRLRKFARRNRSGLVVAGLVFFFMMVLGGGAGWAWRDRGVRAAERANYLERAVERAELLQREGKRGEALAALERAQLLAREAEPGPSLADRIELLQQLLDAEGRDSDFVARFEAIRREVQTEVDAEKSQFRSDGGYLKIREALEQYGIAVGVTLPADAVAHIQKSPAAIQAVVAVALDECRNYTPREDSATRKWLTDVLLKADSDPWRNRVRQAWKKPAMEALARDIDVRQQPPNFLVQVVSALPIESPSRLDLARRVQFAYPGDFWANYRLGFDLALAGQDTEAVRYYTAAISLRPDHAAALHNRGIALCRLGELEAGIADLQRAIAVAPRYADAYANLGIALKHQKKLPQANAALRKAIEINPNPAQAYNCLGSVMRAQKKLAEAIDCYRKAIDINSKDALAYNNLGSALLCDQEKLVEAIVAFRTAIKINPKFAQAHFGLGLSLSKQQKLDEAIDAYHKAIAIDPNHTDYYNGLGHALRGQKKLDQAIEAYRKAIGIDPKNANAYSNLGALLCDDLKEYDKAAECFRKAIDLDPNNADYHFNLGNALRGQRKREEAIAAYRKAIELDPQNAHFRTRLAGLLNGLAWTLATDAEPARRDPSRAVWLAKEAVELEPLQGGHWNTLGAAQYRAGNWKDALAAVGKSMELRKGGDSFDWFFLAMAHGKLGEKDKARQWYDRAVKWTDEYQPKNEELGRFRAEAAKLLELKETK
jgi:superkiller protein 3